VATGPHIAEEALGLIKVDYEVLPPVLDVRKAMQDDAPILLSDLRTVGHRRRVTSRPTSPARCALLVVISKRAFKAADVVIEREFNTSMVHQGYIEPHNAVAQYNADGKATIWSAPRAPSPYASCAHTSCRCR